MDDRSVGSVCSGAGGLDLGLHRAGWRVAWFCEKVPFRRRLLARHWPRVRAYEDLTTLDPSRLLPVRLLAGGTPCQNLSVAGGRAGLEGSESRLFWDFVCVRNALGPEWTLWENVEGALSSNEGLDFASVLAAFVGADVVVPFGGWGGAGVVAGPWGGAVWRVLDAQYFGVPQRRRRVFVVGRLGGPCPPEVLLEPARRRGDPAPSREARARVAAPLTRGSARPGVSELGRRLEDDANIVAALDSQGGGPDENDATGGRLLVEGEMAGTLTRRYGKGTNGTADEGALVFGSVAGEEKTIAPSLDRRSRNGPMQNQDAPIVLPVAATLKGKRGRAGGGLDPEETLVAHALTSEGFDASEDGTGRGTPLVATDEEAIALHLTQTPVSGRISPTFGSEKSRVGVADAVGGGVRRLTPTECERLMGWPDGWTLERGPSLLGSGSGSGSGSGVFVSENQRAEVRETPYARQLTTGGGKPGQGYPMVRTEATSLAGGDRCAVDPLPDGRRFAACGDGVVAPVAEWIGRRILAVDEGRDPDEAVAGMLG